MISNEYFFYADRKEAVRFTVELASGADQNIKEVSSWIRKHSIRGDRFVSMSNDEAIQWLDIVEGTLTYARRLLNLIMEFWLSDSDD